jgi:Tetracyclin repressor-like, C-terminal domain
MSVASLFGSQVVGLAMARYIVGVELLASMPADAVSAAIAPNLQRYLVEPLPTTRPRQ